MDNRIRVQCHTNLDAFTRVDWPGVLACRPEIGDFVAGKQGDELRLLAVVGITHCVGRDGPYLRLDLNKKF